MAVSLNRKDMKRPHLLILSALLVALGVSARPYSALVFPGSFAKPAEQHCYDRALDRLGIEKTYATKADFETGAVFKRLSDFDMIAIPPGFHHHPGKKRIPEGQVYEQDMARHAAPFKKWLQDGGVVVMHDCNYQNRIDWLGEVDPSFALKAGGKGYQGPAKIADGIAPSFFKEPLGLPYFVHWAHLIFPDGTLWKPLATDAKGEPIAAYLPYGKGFVFAMSGWLGEPTPLFSNIRLHGPLFASGLSLESLDLPDPQVGSNRFTAVLANESGAPKKVSLVFGDKRTAKTIAAGAKETLELDVFLSERGVKRLALALECDGPRAVLFDREVRLRDLYELGPTRYRNLLSRDRRFDEILMRSRVSPIDEKIDGAVVRLRVLSPDGKERSSLDTPAAAGVVESKARFPFDLAAGLYRVEGTLLSKEGKVLGKSEQTVEVLPSEPGQVVVDEDLNFIVDGEPFFPLGMYHVHPDDFTDVAELGINMIQLFGWHYSRGLENAWEHRYRTIWQKWEEIEDGVKSYGSNPTLMMWYTLDEPSEGQIPKGVEINDRYHAADKQHMTYLCSCTPDKFDKFAGIADVFGPDPYPHDWDTPDIVAAGSTRPTGSSAKTAPTSASPSRT